MQKQREKSEFPSPDYLNFIKHNKLKLLQPQSSNASKIFNESYQFRTPVNPVNPEAPQPFYTLDYSELHKKNQTLRNKNYEMYYKGNLGEPIFNQRLNDLQAEEIKISRLQNSLETKVRKISRLIYEGTHMEVSKRKEEGRCVSKEKYTAKKSIVALITIDRSNGDIRFPPLKRSQGRSNASLSSSKQKLPLMSKTIEEPGSKDSSNSTPSPLHPISQHNPSNPSVVFTNYPMAKRKAFSSKPQPQKIIETFHEYQRLLKQKQMIVNGIPPIRQSSKKQADELILKPLRKRLKTECLDESNDPSIQLRKIVQDQMGQKQSKDITKTKQLTLKPRLTDSHRGKKKIKPSHSQQVLSHINKVTKKKQHQYKEETIYDMKIKNYSEFVFQINFAHSRFSPMEITDQGKGESKYRAYVGRGNNNLLIRQLLKRRCWWVFEEDGEKMEKCQFVWTQLKVNKIFESLPSVSEDDCVRVENSKNPKIKLPRKRTRNEIDGIKRNKNRPQTKVGVEKIFDEVDTGIYNRFNEIDFSEANNPDYESKIKYLQKRLVRVPDRESFKLHNHLEQNYHIGNKKALFYYMRQYCSLINKNVFNYLPLTFHIKSGLKDKEYEALIAEIKRREFNLKTSKRGPRNIWIVKPGEVSNRGNGITVVNNIIDLNRTLKDKEKHSNGLSKTYIVQSYLDRPLLYNRRKFDIRHYMLITSLYGQIKGYWYSDGYIRTSSEEFSLTDLSNSIIHLTNDAVQKHGCEYGEYQEGNKLSYNDLQRYLDNTCPERKINFYQHIYPKMKEIGTKAIEATFLKLNPKRLEHGFQVLGLDFMIDQDLNVWMIEVNTNPCLQISSPLLGRIIPNMIQQSLRLSLDVLFPPLGHYPNTKKHIFPDYSMEHLKFQMVFDEQRDGRRIRELYKKVDEEEIGQCGKLDEEDQEYNDEGDDESNEEMMNYIK